MHNKLAVKTSYDKKWLVQQDQEVYGDRDSVVESKFDRQLEELKKMNQEINQLKNQQRKTKTNFEIFKV